MSTFLHRVRLRVLLIRMMAGYAPPARRLRSVIKPAVSGRERRPASRYG